MLWIWSRQRFQIHSSLVEVATYWILPEGSVSYCFVLFERWSQKMTELNYFNTFISVSLAPNMVLTPCLGTWQVICWMYLLYMDFNIQLKESLCLTQALMLNQLKGNQLCKHKPSLTGYANYSPPVVWRTDASSWGLWANEHQNLYFIFSMAHWCFFHWPYQTLWVGPAACDLNSVSTPVVCADGDKRKIREIAK